MSETIRRRIAVLTDSTSDLPADLVETHECGPVIGAHAGPGTVGVTFYVE